MLCRFIRWLVSWIRRKPMIAQEKGPLPIITFDAKTTWDDVLRVASPHLIQSGIHRLKKAVDNRAKCVVVETVQSRVYWK